MRVRAHACACVPVQVCIHMCVLTPMIPLTNSPLPALTMVAKCTLDLKNCMTFWLVCAKTTSPQPPQYIRGSFRGGAGGAALTPPLIKSCPPLEVANVLLQLHNCYKVPENAPEAVTESLKIKNFLGEHSPRLPLVYICLYTYTQGFAPPLFLKYSFCPPLDQFLNEPLYIAPTSITYNFLTT